MSTVSRPLLDAEEFHNPNVVKVVTNLAGDALYFSRAPIPGSVPSAALVKSVPSAALVNSVPSAALVTSVPSAALVTSVPSAARAHMGLYVYRRETLLKLAALPAVPLELIESLEQLRALAHGIRIRVVETPHIAMAVDTPADLERVRSTVAALELVRSGGGPHKG
jgi:3-deoxy-manno-octulosonate cytidylyltransferase (CMP-KDO synthetase)